MQNVDLVKKVLFYINQIKNEKFTGEKYSCK
jgi:hypothetical protein